MADNLKLEETTMPCHNRGQYNEHNADAESCRSTADQKSPRRILFDRRR